MYTTLLQDYEQAKIDAVRDTPVITVVAPPYVPVFPDSRRLGTLTIVGAFIGVFIAAMAAVVHAYLREFRAAETETRPSFVAP